MDTKLKTGWLSPTGEFIKCESYEHIGIAMKIAESYKDYHGMESADIFINKKGWIGIHLSIFGIREWTISGDGRISITEEQRQFLKPYMYDIIKPSFVLTMVMND